MLSEEETEGERKKKVNDAVEGSEKKEKQEGEQEQARPFCESPS